MNNPAPFVFERIDGIAIGRLTGQYTYPSGVHLLRDAIAQAREQSISRLMLVITETTGYEVPSLSMRLGMMREWAEAANGFVRLVIVCRPEFIDPNKFGVTMAAQLWHAGRGFLIRGRRGRVVAAIGSRAVTAGR